MKKFLSLLCALLLLLLAVLPSFAATDTEPSAPEDPLPAPAAQAAILMDADTGAILFQKNMTEKLSPASVLKILTVLLGIESGKADQTVTVPKSVVDGIDKDDTHISLVENEEVRLGDLFYAAMMASAHDASAVIALGVSGSESAFVELMNTRMREIGATGTHFTNSTGAKDKNCYTTAQDLALLTKEALKNETFREIFGKVTYTMPATNKNASTRAFTTLCLLLKNNDKNARYEAAIGGKTGWDSVAGYTMVSAAKKGDRTLICVVLNASSSQERYDDSIALFDYGFSAFRNVRVPTSLLPETEIPVVKNGVTVRKIKVSIPEGTMLTTNADFRDGTMTVTSALPSYLTEDTPDLRLTVSAKDQNGATVVLGTVILDIDAKDIPVEEPGGEKEVTPTVWDKIGKVLKTILIVIGCILGGIIVLVGLLVLVSYLQTRKRKRRRQQLRQEREERERREEARANAYTGKRSKHSK